MAILLAVIRDTKVNGSRYSVDLSVEVNQRIRKARCIFRKYTIKLYDRPSAPLELKHRMLKAEVLETMLCGRVTWGPRTFHYDTLRRVHHSFLTRCIGRQKNIRTDHPSSYLDTLMKTRSESIKVILRRRRILFAGCVTRMEDMGLLKCVTFGELTGSAGCVGGRGKSRYVVFEYIDHTVSGCLITLYNDLELVVNPNMTRNRSKAVPQSNDLVPHHDKFGSGGPTMADLHRILEENFDIQWNRLKSHFDRQYTTLGELTEKMGATNQRLADLPNEARQPHLTTKADVEPDMKTRKRTENAAGDRAKNGNIAPARVDDGPTSLTSFGMIPEALLMALEKFIGDALASKGAEALKPHLPCVEVRCNHPPPMTQYSPAQLLHQR